MNNNQLLLSMIVFVTILSFLPTPTFAQTTLSQEELNSAIWLIKQYKMNLPMDQSLCNSAQTGTIIFTCQIVGGQYHITRIDHSAEMIAPSNGMPDPTLQSLTFPGLTNFKVTADKSVPVADSSINVLTLLKDLPNLSTITVDGFDTSVNSFPPTLFQLPVFRGFSCQCSFPINLQFFNNSNLWQILLTQPSMNNVVDDTLYLPKLVFLSLKLTSTTPLLYQFTAKSFPKLETIDIYNDSPYKFTVIHSSPIPISIYLRSSIVNYKPYYEFITSEPSQIISLHIIGPSSTYSPMNNFENIYTNLQYIYFDSLQITTYPFNTFPKKLTQMNFINTYFTSIPNIPLPSAMSLISFVNNTLQGNNPIPWSIFDPIIKLDNLLIDQNEELTGTISQSACNKVNYLSITLTAYNSVPDCFWCYPGHLLTSLPKPGGFVCPIQVTNLNLVTIFGIATIEGTNIGWGGLSTALYTLTSDIPNSKLKLFIPQFFNYYSPKNLDIIFLGGGGSDYIRTFSITEAGINTTINLLTMTQQINSVFFTLGFISVNPNLPHNVTVNSQPCPVQNLQSTFTFTCNLLVSGDYNLRVSNQYNYASLNFKYVQAYPSVSSGVITNGTGNSKIINLNGNFGSYGQTNSIILINNTIPCDITFKNSNLLTCTLQSISTFGSASVFVSVDGANFTGSNLLYFTPPSSSNPGLKEQCEERTHNCYGNGQCQDDGTCKCNPNYNPIDDCLTQFINNTVPIETNQTAPTTRFEIEGVQFMFELYSIDEMDVDGSIINQVFTKKWNSTVSKIDDLTTANYSLVSSDTDATVNAFISFSPNARQVVFGDQNISINPNSIKVSVDVYNWKYSSNIATLRVVFRTIINNNQVVGICGDEKSIDLLSYDLSGSTIQYLRVAKDNIQFTGRFLDYVLSDGRTTYSSTQLVSLKPLENSDDESVAMIGINFPQCKQCSLDPDFTPLIIDNSRVSGCGSDEKSNTWKIAVGVSVGGAVFIALLIGTILYLRDSNVFRFKVKNAKSIFMKKF